MKDEEIFAKLALFKKEIDTLRQNWDLATIGHANIRDVMEIHRKMNAELLEKVRQQDRAIAHMMGEKIEPEAHFGEAVLLPVGGMG